MFRTRWQPIPVYHVIQIVQSISFALAWSFGLVYQAITAGLTPLQLVLVGTALEISAFVFEIPTGIIADLVSRRLSTILGYSLLGIAFIISGSIPVFEAILFASVLMGLGYTFISGAMQAWFVDEMTVFDGMMPDEGRLSALFLRAGQYARVASFFAIAAGIGLASVDLGLPTVIGGVVALGLALFLAVYMPEKGFKPAPRTSRNPFGEMRKTLREGLSIIRASRILILIVGVTLVMGLYSEGLDRLWTKHVLEIGLPIGATVAVAFGLIRMGDALIGIALAEGVRRLVDTSTPRRLVRALTVMSGLQIALMATFALSSAFVPAIFALWLVQTLRGLQGSLYDAWVNPQIPSARRATVLSTLAQMDAIGQIGGGPLVGWVGNASVRAALLISTALLLPVLPLYWQARRYTRDALPEILNESGGASAAV